MGYGTSESGLLLPDNVLQATGEYVSAKQAAQDSVEASWFRELLKEVDPRYDLIFVKPGSRAFPESPRFYIVKTSESLPDQYWAIRSETGGYATPTQAHFDRFMAGDQERNPRIWEEFRKNQAAKRQRAQKRKEELRAEFREGLEERLKVVFDGKGVLITGDHKKKLGMNA